jgi:hypothetical protein
MGGNPPIQYTNTTTYDDVKAAMGFDGRLKYHNRNNPMTIPDFQKIKKPFQKYPIDFEIYWDKRIDRLNATYLDNEKQFEFKNKINIKDSNSIYNIRTSGIISGVSGVSDNPNWKCNTHDIIPYISLQTPLSYKPNISNFQTTSLKLINNKSPWIYIKLNNPVFHYEISFEIICNNYNKFNNKYKPKIKLYWGLVSDIENEDIKRVDFENVSIEDQQKLQDALKNQKNDVSDEHIGPLCDPKTYIPKDNSSEFDFDVKNNKAICTAVQPIEPNNFDSGIKQKVNLQENFNDDGYNYFIIESKFNYFELEESFPNLDLELKYIKFVEASNNFKLLNIGQKTILKDITYYENNPDDTKKYDDNAIIISTNKNIGTDWNIFNTIDPNDSHAKSQIILNKPIRFKFDIDWCIHIHFSVCSIPNEVHHILSESENKPILSIHKSEHDGLLKIKFLNTDIQKSGESNRYLELISFNTNNNKSTMCNYNNQINYKLFLYYSKAQKKVFVYHYYDEYNDNLQENKYECNIQDLNTFYVNSIGGSNAKSDSTNNQENQENLDQKYESVKNLHGQISKLYLSTNGLPSLSNSSNLDQSIYHMLKQN